VADAGHTTWTWTGSDWSQFKPGTSPVNQGAFGLSYVNSLGVVLVGGDPAGPPYEFDLSNVWVFKGGTWSELSRAAPTVPGPCAVAYDADARALLLVPFETKGTWTWDGSSWTEQHPIHSPPIIGYSAIGYDPVSRQVVLFGGKTDSLNGAPVLDQTWIWNSSDWQQR
jgi:hypothetical protein